MEEPFHPRLSLHMRVPHPLSTVVMNTLRFAATIMPTILCLVACFYLIRLTTEVREMKQALEISCPTPAVSEPDSPASWTAEPETVTMTMTVQGPSRSRRWFGDVAVTIPSATPADTVDGWPSPPPLGAQPYAFVTLPAQTGAAADLSSTSGGERSAFVLPLKIWLPPWPPTFDLPPRAQEVADEVMEGLSVVWQILRKLYHYPLEPPS
jgi:hypothetical protein